MVLCLLYLSFLLLQVRISSIIFFGANVKYLKLTVVSGIIATALVYLFFYDAISSFIAPCPFYAATGLYCPGCGTLRALRQLIHGNLLGAFRLNPLMVLLLPFVGYALISQALLKVIGRSLPGVFIKPFWIWALLGIILLYWILRNVPFYPFCWLAP